MCSCSRDLMCLFIRWILQISDLKSSMQKNWPTLACPSNDGTDFWSHEWEKHGTCSESVLSQHDYFEASLALKEKIGLLNILKSAGKMKLKSPCCTLSRLGPSSWEKNTGNVMSMLQANWC